MAIGLLIGGILVMVAAFWLLHRQYRHSVSYLEKHFRKTVFDVLPDEGWELKSTGMSLMICRALVRLLDGTIYVDPHIDDGTSVVFDIKE